MITDEVIQIQSKNNSSQSTTGLQVIKVLLSNPEIDLSIGVSWAHSEDHDVGSLLEQSKPMWQIFENYFSKQMDELEDLAKRVEDLEDLEDLEGQLEDFQKRMYLEFPKANLGKLMHRFESQKRTNLELKHKLSSPKPKSENSTQDVLQREVQLHIQDASLTHALTN